MERLADLLLAVIVLGFGLQVYMLMLRLRRFEDLLLLLLERQTDYSLDVLYLW
jgi:hypothetical protein